MAEIEEHRVLDAERVDARGPGRPRLELAGAEGLAGVQVAQAVRRLEAGARLLDDRAVDVDGHPGALGQLGEQLLRRRAGVGLAQDRPKA